MSVGGTRLPDGALQTTYRSGQAGKLEVGADAPAVGVRGHPQLVHLP
jgi:hypothetical protein